MSSPPISLKVLTANIHKGFSPFNRRFVLPQLRDALHDIAPDLVFLQEVVGNHTKHWACFSDYPSTSHYEYLADRMWPEHAYGRNAIYTEGHHGNAVLSKFSIVHAENHNISLGRLQKRGLLHCVLQLPDQRQAHVICVHLSLQESQRREQLQLLCRLIEREVPGTEPLIVAGDFNDWRERAHAVLEREVGLHEVFVQAQLTAAKTFPARWPFLQLDRIYVRNVASHHPLALPRNPWSRLSDHIPLTAQVLL